MRSLPSHKLVVLDDDPTGTQTVYDVPVLTQWSVELLRREFEDPLPCFYVLTNSRSRPHEQAKELNREVARNLKAAAGDHPFTIVSRSDSTLRGHFPLETDVLAEELGPFDATILIPYFEAGGRYTIQAVHYVAEGDKLVPASQTPFARDAVFGYRHSNLRDWVQEKTDGKIHSSHVASISIDTLRTKGPAGVTEQLLSVRPRAMVVVDAADPRDLDVFITGLQAAEQSGKRYLFRTAAEFVAARLGLESRPLLTAAELESTQKASGGGLILVGSYVRKTTEQLQLLRLQSGLEQIELDVKSLLNSASHPSDLTAAIDRMNSALADNRDVVVFTSRELITGDDAATSLDIGRRVSEALVKMVHALTVRPKYLIAKGGITSSDLATRGLGVQRAIVAGQLLPGIPVWRIGKETKWPGLTYVVFPGNVGGPEALATARDRLASTLRVTSAL